MSETFDQHIQDLDAVFARLKAAGLKLGPKKCKFAQLPHQLKNYVVWLVYSIGSENAFGTLAQKWNPSHDF